MAKNGVIKKNKVRTKTGNAAIELLVMLVIIVITSGVILYLVHSGIIAVKAEHEEVPILNAEFIPFVREGYLTVKDFRFCSSIDEQYNCLPEQQFSFGEKIYFTFVVESSVYNGEVLIVENYRIKGSDGRVLLDVDEKNNFHFDINSRNKHELIKFKDYFVVNRSWPSGMYTLELVIKNPLLDKTATLTQDFAVVER